MQPEEISQDEELLPCPFCGAGETLFVEGAKVWLGMRYGEPVSVSIQHWCPSINGQPTRVIERCGKTKADAINAWNMRHE